MSGTRGIRWWRMWSLQGSFEPRGLQTIGWLHVLAPWLRQRFDDAETARWIESEPEAFNTNPYCIGLVAGVRIRVEEDAGEVQGRSASQALQRSMGALGDSLSWSGLHPAFQWSAAVGTWLLGAPVALATWLVALVLQGWFRHWGLRWGLEQGIEAGVQLSGLPLQKVARIAARVAAVMAGVLGSLVLIRASDAGVSLLPLLFAGIILGAVVVTLRLRGRPELAVLVVVIVGWILTRWAELSWKV